MNARPYRYTLEDVSAVASRLGFTGTVDQINDAAQDGVPDAELRAELIANLTAESLTVESDEHFRPYLQLVRALRAERS